MTLSQFITIFITAVITAACTNIFAYLKDKKFASSKYTEKVLTEFYVPIYKIVTKDFYTGKGYDGLYPSEIIAIKKLVDEKPELADPVLDRIIGSLSEDAFRIQGTTPEGQEPNKMDEQGVLLNYILKSFQKTRKSLGLPHETLTIKLRNKYKKI